MTFSTQLRHVKMLDSLHFIRKSSAIAQNKRIFMEKKFPADIFTFANFFADVSFLQAKFEYFDFLLT